MEGSDRDAYHSQGIEQTSAGELTHEEKEEIYTVAVWHAGMKLSLYIHTVVFVLVMLLLLVINLLTSSGTLWVVWPFGGWGLGLAVHWLAIMKLVPMYQSMKEKEIVRQLELRQGQ